MNWKEAYTKIFLKEQGKSANDVTIKEFMPLWWKNTRDKGEGGLRLTDAGLDLINEMTHDYSVVVCDDYKGKWSEKDLYYADRNQGLNKDMLLMICLNFFSLLEFSEPLGPMPFAPDHGVMII